jgi:hypothetical protein
VDEPEGSLVQVSYRQALLRSSLLAVADSIQARNANRGSVMITRQQIRDVGRREIDLQIDANAGYLSRRERRKLTAQTHRKAWKRSKGGHRAVIAQIVEKQRKDTEIANRLIEAMC